MGDWSEIYSFAHASTPEYAYSIYQTLPLNALPTNSPTFCLATLELSHPPPLDQNDLLAWLVMVKSGGVLNIIEYDSSFDESAEEETFG